MQFILVNKGSGIVYYAQIAENGAVKKVQDRSLATVFDTQYDADKAKKDHKKKLMKFQKECIKSIQNGNEIDSEQTGGKRKQLSKAIRMKIYNQAEGRCTICGDFVPFDEFTIDHIYPIAKGGTNEISNLQCTCESCNRMKQAMSEQEFRHKIGKVFRKQILMKIMKRG